MSHYRRNYIEGGTFFFTVKLADPKSRLLLIRQLNIEMFMQHTSPSDL